MPGLMPCPPLVKQAADGTTASYGALIGRSTELIPLTCVELYVGGERVALGSVGLDGAVVLPFVARGDIRGTTVRARFEELQGHTGPQWRSIPLPRETSADIAHDPESTPVVARLDGQIEVTAWLEPVGLPDPPYAVWVANPWLQGLELVRPTPRFRESFTGEVLGLPYQSPIVISQHRASGVGAPSYGACWWPRGNGCWARCSEELQEAGLCSSGPGVPCTGGRGCSVLSVDERRSGVPPAVQTDRTPTGRPDAGRPRDAAVIGRPPEAGVVDAEVF